MKRAIALVTSQNCILFIDVVEAIKYLRERHDDAEIVDPNRVMNAISMHDDAELRRIFLHYLNDGRPVDLKDFRGKLSIYHRAIIGSE